MLDVSAWRLAIGIRFAILNLTSHHFCAASLPRRQSVLVTENWLESTGAGFAPRGGFAGAAHLTHYTVDYRIWGEGDPIVLIPGLAGGMGLLGPLAKLLAQDYKVICYELRGEDNCFAIRRPFGLCDLVGDLHE